MKYMEGCEDFSIEVEPNRASRNEWVAIVSGVKDFPMYFYGGTPTLALMKATLDMMENE